MSFSFNLSYRASVADVQLAQQLSRLTTALNAPDLVTEFDALPPEVRVTIERFVWEKCGEPTRETHPAFYPHDHDRPWFSDDFGRRVFCAIHPNYATSQMIKVGAIGHALLQHAPGLLRPHISIDAIGDEARALAASLPPEFAAFLPVIEQRMQAFTEEAIRMMGNGGDGVLGPQDMCRVQ